MGQQKESGMIESTWLEHDRLQTGLGELVARLYDDYSAPIFSYLYRLTGDWEMAHDLTQETFVQLLRTSPRLPEVENRRAWLYRIASHVAFNALKRRRRFAWLPFLDTWLSPGDDTAAQADFRTDVDRAMAQLAPGYRAPLLLYSYHGLSVRDVALSLGLSEGVVKKRLYRARHMFRQAYERGSTR